MLLVPKLTFPSPSPFVLDVGKALDALGPGHEIANVNWAEYPYKPSVRFNIAHNGHEIFLKFYVDEKDVKAEKEESNQMVCEDSCVEFFVSPDDDGIYYNFEFNPIGTCLLGKGSGRADSKVLDPSYIDKIRRFGSYGNMPFSKLGGERHRWTLVMAIPLEAFAGKNIGSLSGKRFKANFYKCGDTLDEMHFLSWQPVKTEKPDFHRPEFFGEIVFE